MSGAEASAKFWDGAPCGRGDSFEERSATRFKREPWVPALLREVATHSDIVEVGCGQGTDALSICKSMRPGGRYARWITRNRASRRRGLRARKLPPAP